ncbi:hypothetical protein O6H91_Y234400 [Diphasiastrum complanatum]|nr:hypothetical protein O6H91_Y234400 [Diphasiastrum complanatum]
MVVIHIKNQALLQMQDVNVTQYDPEVQPIERGRNVYIQHSLHPEVTIVDQTGSTRRPSNDQVCFMLEWTRAFAHHSHILDMPRMKSNLMLHLLSKQAIVLLLQTLLRVFIAHGKDKRPFI